MSVPIIMFVVTTARMHMPLAKQTTQKTAPHGPIRTCTWHSMIMTMRVTYELWDLHLGIHRRGPRNIHIGGVTFRKELRAVGLNALVVGVEVAAVATPEVGVAVGVGNLVGCHVSSNLQKQWCTLGCELRWPLQRTAAEFNNSREADPEVKVASARM